MKALVHKFFLPECDILFRKAERGCVCVTWLTSPSIATLLQQNLTNIETDFFKEHNITAVAIDKDTNLTPDRKYGDYISELYTEFFKDHDISTVTIGSIFMFGKT